MWLGLQQMQPTATSGSLSSSAGLMAFYTRGRERIWESLSRENEFREQAILVLDGRLYNPKRALESHFGNYLMGVGPL